jgi:hypothetical protein
MVNDVDVSAEGKALEASDNAQGFGVERIRSADGFLKDAGEYNFCLCGPTSSVRCF